MTTAAQSTTNYEFSTISACSKSRSKSRPTSIPSCPTRTMTTILSTPERRSYLHTNCSICHVDGGGGNARISLLFHLPEHELNLVDHPPMHHDFGLPDPKLVSPGHPERSVLFHRISTRGQGQMPPLGTTVVDEKAVKLLHEWIKSKPSDKK